MNDQPDKLRIATVALESSGRKWMDSVLAQHPDLEVNGVSFPAHVDAGLRGYYVPDLRSFDVLVIGVRDQSCHRQSVIASGYEAQTPGKFRDSESIREVQHLVARAQAAGKKVAFMSYESALTYGQLYWDWLFTALGTYPVDVKTEYRDGNVKYFSVSKSTHSEA